MTAMPKDRPGYFTFTPEAAKVFEAAYKKAVEAGDAQFEFSGVPILTNYAKYMVEYFYMEGLL